MAIKRQLKLGDAVANVARALHIPHCEKCEQRRLILNEIALIGIKETMRRLGAIGLSRSKKKSGKAWTVEELIKKMEDCCNNK